MNESKIPDPLGKYATDAPETKDQAEELLKQYYKEHRGEKNFPRRPNLLSWKLYRDGTMTVVDGATGRKLEFVTDTGEKAKATEAETAEDAEQALLDAEADAEAAEAEAKQARLKAEEAKELLKANKKAATVRERKEKSDLASTKAN